MAECYSSSGKLAHTLSVSQPERLCSMLLERPSVVTVQDGTRRTMATYSKNACCAGMQCQLLQRAEELNRLIWEGELCRIIDREVNGRAVARMKEIKNGTGKPRSSTMLGSEASSDLNMVQEKVVRDEELDKFLRELRLSRIDYNELKESQSKRHQAVHPALQVKQAVQEWRQLKRAGTKRISQ